MAAYPFASADEVRSLAELVRITPALATIGVAFAAGMLSNTEADSFADDVIDFVTIAAFAASSAASEPAVEPSPAPAGSSAAWPSQWDTAAGNHLNRVAPPLCLHSYSNSSALSHPGFHCLSLTVHCRSLPFIDLTAMCAGGDHLEAGELVSAAKMWLRRVHGEPPEKEHEPATSTASGYGYGFWSKSGSTKSSKPPPTLAELARERAAAMAGAVGQLDRLLRASPVLTSAARTLLFELTR